ncbi:MAG: aconitase X [Pseudomonadota bacterium]
MTPRLDLTAAEQKSLSGDDGQAMQWAMETIVAAADAMDAERLTAISSAHLVGAYHSGPANVALLEKLLRAEARVSVPTTLNASSADLTDDAASCFRGSAGADARKVVRMLTQMGCAASLTCAPYFLKTRPQFGDRVAWAETNAILFANSVIGARTLKTPQYLDLAAALTGKLPEADVLTDEGRAPALCIDASVLSRWWFTDAVAFELIGYAVGGIAGSRIPYVYGLPDAIDQLMLRSMCAAMGAAGGIAMAHIEGSTPEAENGRAHCEAADLFSSAIKLSDVTLFNIRKTLGDSATSPVSGVFIGSPHLGLEDIARLNQQIDDRKGALKAPLYASLGRDVYEEAARAGFIAALSARGVQFVRDTCTYYTPLADNLPLPVVTTSAKWAAYGRAGLNVDPIIATQAEAVEAALTGEFNRDDAYWRP